MQVFSSTSQTNAIELQALENQLEQGIIKKESLEYEAALEIFFFLIEKLESTQNEDETIIKAKTYSEVASTYQRIGFYDDAIEYIDKAIKTAEVVDDEMGLAEFYVKKSGILYYKIEANEDKNVSQPSLIVESRSLYKKALDIKQRLEPNNNMALLFSSIADTYLQSRDLDQSVEWSLKAISEANKHGDIKDQVFSTVRLSRAYVDLERYDDAIFVAEESLLTIEQTNTGNEYASSFHYNLYDAYRNKGNTEKALFHLEKYTQFSYSEAVSEKDISSIYNQRLRNKAKELEKRESLTDERVKKIRNFNFALLAILATLALIGFQYYRGQKLKQQNLQLKLKQKEQEAELSTINAMMDGREIERNEIGRFLHDHVSALVNAANIQLEVLASQKDLRENNKLQTTQSILDDIADKVRNLSHRLLSNVLHKFGLAVALDDLCKNLTGSTLSFTTHSSLPEGKRYQESIENKLYSVVQELCNNIIKHSNATEANIYIKETTTHLQLIITDNGIGFEHGDVKKGGVGLYQVKTRINSMGGQLTIRENKKPTTIEINIPLAVAMKPNY